MNKPAKSFRSKTIVDLLRNRAEHEPDGSAFAFLERGVKKLTYRELAQAASAIAQRLSSLRSQGERAILLYPPGLDFIAAFFGCLAAGVVAVPAPSPGVLAQRRHTPLLRSLIRDSGASLILMLSHLDFPVKNIEEGVNIESLLTDEIHEKPEKFFHSPLIEREGLAYLQYTSGSTRDPRGVMISHENIMEHSEVLRKTWDHGHDSLVVSWLPHFHDMGLIEGIILPLYSGIPSILMSPISFLKRPIDFLEAASIYGATHFIMPDFAYALCADKTTPMERARLDLSSIRSAANGSETIRAGTLRRFCKVFSQCGFKKSAICPGYGLAEATLVVSVKRPGGKVSVLQLSTNALEKNLVREADRRKEKASSIVGCGSAIETVDIAIVNPETHFECGRGEVGEIWANGPSVARGYWKRPSESQDHFNAHIKNRSAEAWLRTGDLGFIKDGELFITGRIKDLIIIDGVNHYPQDIEYTVEECHPAIRKNHCVAFSTTLEEMERLVLLIEVRKISKDAKALIGIVRNAVAEAHGVDVYAISLVRYGKIARTSNGKLQRHICRMRFQKNELNPLFEWKRNSRKECGAQKGFSPSLADIERWLILKISEHVSCMPEEVSIDEPFEVFGLSSKDGLALMTSLEQWLGRECSPLLYLNHPNIRSLSRHLAPAPASGRIEVLPGLDSHLTAPASLREPREPVAVVGMACRFPGGADNPEKFWDMLCRGADATGELPFSRHRFHIFDSGENESRGKSIPARGGYLEDIDKFDPHFFGISPKEAESIDPQQRLLLEVCWEALEDACVDWKTLEGSLTGVFVGISTSDYRDLMIQTSGFEGKESYFPMGAAPSAAAGRISHALGLRGPSIAIDTACSSSLVAVDLACESLLSGKSRQALAGGVNLILSSTGALSLSRYSLFSADGRCRSFDAASSGYGRSEGCGIVLLKRLSEAIADEDRIMALVTGSAVNHNGRTSGFTAPGSDAQRELIEHSLSQAGTHPSKVGYFEAHGSGTPLGDMIEIEAIVSSMSKARRASEPLYLGSVKTNVGHMEAAAGIGGFIKTVLMLMNGEIPPHLHFKRPNRLIKWEEHLLKVPKERTPWEPAGQKRIAGVNSFGLSGINAHVTLEEATRVRSEDDESPAQSSNIFIFSGHDEQALRNLARQNATYLRENREIPLSHISYSLGRGRRSFPARLSIVASSREELCDRLELFLGGKRAPGLVTGNAGRSQSPKVAFLFTGQGSQYLQMGRELYETQQQFRKMIDRCDSFMRKSYETSLVELIYPGKCEDWRLGSRRLGPYPESLFATLQSGRMGTIDEAGTCHPALFSVGMALYSLWSYWGIRPACLLGHSLGEYIAACAAGVFTVEDALTLIIERARLVEALCDEGEMITVFAEEAEVETLLKESGLEKFIFISISNGPGILTISGNKNAMERVKMALDAKMLRFLPLKVSRAYHSPSMKPMIPSFRRIASRIRYSPPEITLFSNVTGRPAGAEIADPEYWCRHIQERVMFSESVRNMLGEGIEMLIELGPSPLLIGLIQCHRSSLTENIKLLPSLNRGVSDISRMLQSLGALYVDGIEVNWREYFQSLPRGKVSLPKYPWKRKSYWWSGSPQGKDGGAIIDIRSGKNWEKLVAIMEKSGELSSREIEIIRKALKGILASDQGEEEDLLYEVKWEPKESEKSTEASPRGHYMVFADACGFCSNLAELLRNKGESCSLIYMGETYGRSENGAWIMNPRELSKIFPERFMEEPGKLPLKGVLYGWGLNRSQGGIDAMRLTDSVIGFINLAKTLVSYRQPVPLHIITGGAVSIEGFPGEIDPAQSPLWALARAFSLEHPEIMKGLIDIDNRQDSAEAEVGRIYAEIVSRGAFDHTAFRSGTRYICRLQRIRLKAIRKPLFRSDRTYLVTGGSGGIGRNLARWMILHGACHIVLTGRHPVTLQDRIFLNKLSSPGIRVTYRKKDVTNIGDMEDLFAGIDRSNAPLAGIFHLAGRFDYGNIEEVSPGTFVPQKNPKIQGAWNLHMLTENRPLDFFVMFSSAASLIGGRGLGLYGAANAYLDSVAILRRSLGLPALSINWGPWEESGMTESATEAQKLMFSRAGVRMMTAEKGLGILELLLGQTDPGLPPPGVCAISVDWSVLRNHIPPFMKDSFLSLVVKELRPAPGRIEAGDSGEENNILDLPYDERAVETLVAEEAARVLNLDSKEAIFFDQSFLERGMDSLMTIDLITRLSRLSGAHLSPSLFSQYSKFGDIKKEILRAFDEHSHGDRGGSGAPGIAGPERYRSKKEIIYTLAGTESCKYVEEIIDCLSAEQFIQYYSREDLMEILREERAILVFADRKLIGFAFWDPLPARLCLFEAISRAPACAYVMMTAFIRKEYRGRRIGSKLIYLRNELLRIDENVLINSIFDERLKSWAERIGFRRMRFGEPGDSFLRYYCDCEAGRFRAECAYRDRECELFAHFPGAPYTPSSRPDASELHERREEFRLRGGNIRVSPDYSGIKQNRDRGVKRSREE